MVIMPPRPPLDPPLMSMNSPGLAVGRIASIRRFRMSKIAEVSPGRATRPVGSEYSPGPDPSRPTLVAEFDLRSTTSTILSRVSIATTRPSFSSRTPLTEVNGSEYSASGLESVFTGTFCASAGIATASPAGITDHRSNACMGRTSLRIRRASRVTAPDRVAGLGCRGVSRATRRNGLLQVSADTAQAAPAGGEARTDAYGVSVAESRCR